jgi:hypothetical protein
MVITTQEFSSKQKSVAFNMKHRKCSFSRIENVLQRSSESVCKRWPCRDHREHLENPSKLWKQLSKPGILEKLKKKGRA